jgi:DNA-binding beta-propeller fold protein YncE
VAWARGQIFVANYDGDSISVFSRDAAGDVAPSRTILGQIGDGPHQIAIRHGADELFVANNLAYSVAVYDLASGTLKRVISGRSTGLIRPTGIAVDDVNEEIYVANDLGGTVTVYEIWAAGDVSPKRTIRSASIARPVGIAVDLAHDEIVVANYGSGRESIAIFERLSEGDSLPKRTIEGSNTALNLPQGVAVDPIHDEIVVANSAFFWPDRGSILTFPRTADGDVAPIRTLAGSATQLCNPIGVALDLATSELVVANSNFGLGSCAQSVTTYGRTASGNTAPQRTVAGSLTALEHPASVAITSASEVKVTSRPASPSVRAGDEVVYTVATAARGGPVFDVVLTDRLPRGFAWSLRGNDASSCTLSAAPDSNLTCSFGDLAKDESRAVLVSAVSTTGECDGITNRATVSYHDGTARMTSVSPPGRITIRCRSFAKRGTAAPRGGF